MSKEQELMVMLITARARSRGVSQEYCDKLLGVTGAAQTFVDGTSELWVLAFSSYFMDHDETSLSTLLANVERIMQAQKESLDHLLKWCAELETMAEDEVKRMNAGQN